VVHQSLALNKDISLYLSSSLSAPSQLAVATNPPLSLNRTNFPAKYSA